LIVFLWSIYLKSYVVVKKNYFFAFFLILIVTAYKLSAEEPPRVLLLNSYHKGYLWTDDITRGVEDVLLQDNIDLHIEYLDFKRFIDNSYMDLLSQLISKKHSTNQYDVIISSDNIAFDFYKERGFEIFGDIPLVFCGLNYVQPEDIEDLGNITGVNEKADIKENLNLIKSIHPDCEKIIIITDDTATGKKIQEQFSEIQLLKNSNDPELELIFDLTSEELKSKLENLNNRTIVFLTVFSRDKKSEFFEYDQGVEMITLASAVPVYGTWDFQLNHGIVGGYLVDGYNQGVAAAKKVLKILAGEDINNIPVEYETPYLLQFDFNQLNKFKINKNRLPSHRLIINEPVSFYSLYKTPILIIISTFLMLFLAFMGVAYGFIHSRRAEKLISFNEESLRTTLYSIGDAVISTDLNSRVVRMNPAAEVLTGWDNESAINKPIEEVFKIFHAITGEILDNPISKVLKTGSIVGLIHHTSLITRDGREFKISDSAAPIHDDSGEITGVVLVFRNVSEEYRIQEELLKERNYAERIIENAPSLICGISNKGITTFINPVIEKISGYRENEIIGKNFWKLFYPGEEFQQVKKQIDKADDGIVVDYEMTLTCKNGDKKDIVWNSFARKNEEGQIVGYLGFGYDITEQKKDQIALQNSRRRLRTIIDLVPSSIFVKNINGKFLAVNRAMTKNLGLDIHDIIGKHQKEIYKYPDLVDKMLKEDRAVIETSLHMEIAEEKYPDSTGDYIWQKTVKVPCPEDLFGEPAVLGIATDISGIKKVEERLFEINKELMRHKNNLEDIVAERTLKLQESLDHLRLTQDKLIESEKMAALGGLVAGVAHEINTPVGIGVTAASHLEESTLDFEEKYKSGNMSKSDFERFMDLSIKSSNLILVNMKRASDLIQSFKQVAVDQSSQEKREFKIHKYVDEILLSLNSELHKTPFHFIVNCPEEFKINSYPGALSQILTNLVMNSLHHGFENMEEGTITIDIRKSDENVLIVYGDTGCGIPEKNLDKIFEPFFTTKRGSGGSGLGMNIVYNLVRQSLSGTIKCSSIVGVGTWFEIEFPIEQSS
jgi:PAS domain S-box-containing protein